jgi:putative drug exporter of the RND superfamily
LVPAVMHVLGRANWWAPKPLVRLHARFGVSESGNPDRHPAAPAPEPAEDSGRVAASVHPSTRR